MLKPPTISVCPVNVTYAFYPCSKHLHDSTVLVSWNTPLKLYISLWSNNSYVSIYTIFAYTRVNIHIHIRIRIRIHIHIPVHIHIYIWYRWNWIVNIIVYSLPTGCVYSHLSVVFCSPPARWGSLDFIRGTSCPPPSPPPAPQPRVGTAGPQPWAPDSSGGSAAPQFTAGPQPRAPDRQQWALPDPNCGRTSARCQRECQIESQKECQNRCEIGCQKECQRECKIFF